MTFTIILQSLVTKETIKLYSIIMIIFLVYWGLMPQQQPGSYQGGGNDDDEISFLVEETGVPRGNH